MGYLTNEKIGCIAEKVQLIPYSSIVDITKYSFDSSIEEYNSFLYSASEFDKMNVSKTHLLLHKETDTLLGYMTLSTDSIKLKMEEKELHDLTGVPFFAIPALKVGRLAVNKCIPTTIHCKGYGSFLLEMAKAFALGINKSGIACRFVTVDADIEYNASTVDFYRKNGFVENMANRSRNAKNTVSMRLDVLG